MSSNLLKTIPASFYSASVYRKAGQEWGEGRRYLYLLILLALSLLFVFTGLGARFYVARHRIVNYIGQEAEFFINQAPTLHFDKGKASSSIAGPKYIRNKAGQAIVLIDTQKTVNEAMGMHKYPIFFARDGIVTYTKKNTSETIEVHRYSSVYKGTIDKNYLKKIVSGVTSKLIIYIAPFILLIGYVLCLILLYIYRFFYGLIGALIALLCRLIFGRRISFAGLLSIAFVAMTPAIVIWTILALFFIRMPWHPNLFYAVLTIVYLVFGVLSNPKKMT